MFFWDNKKKQSIKKVFLFTILLNIFFAPNAISIVFFPFSRSKKVYTFIYIFTTKKSNISMAVVLSTDFRFISINISKDREIGVTLSRATVRSL